LAEGVVSFVARFDVEHVKRLDSWITWGVVGGAIGFALGANAASVILVAVGLGAFLLYLHLHGPAIESVDANQLAVAGAADVQEEQQTDDDQETPARPLLPPKSEGDLFAAGGVFMVAWLLGFVVRGLIFGAGAG
jgi:hypothetical protein